MYFSSMLFSIDTDPVKVPEECSEKVKSGDEVLSVNVAFL